MRVDDLTRPRHRYLTPNDACYHIGEFSGQKDETFNSTKRLVIELKKPMDRRPFADWKFKSWAIDRVAQAFRDALHPDALDSLTFVPVPPSKGRGDPLHDDRLTRVLRRIRREPYLDVRELVVQATSTPATHDSWERPTPDQIVTRYRVDMNLVRPKPRMIAIVDDVLTTGAHYRAVRTVLLGQFRDVRIIGLFFARRVPGADVPAGGHYSVPMPRALSRENPARPHSSSQHTEMGFGGSRLLPVPGGRETPNA